MKILALTGSIGMGKSTAAAMLRQMGIAVYCADEAVHRLLGPGGAAVAEVARLFPSALKKTAEGREFIDRKILGAAAFHDGALMKKLEKILHRGTRCTQNAFLKRARRMRKRLVVIDIPLLFETGGERRADHVLVVTAPPFIQHLRVMARPGMTPSRLRAIRARQMPDHEKRKRADSVIPTGLGRAFTWRRLERALRRVW